LLAERSANGWSITVVGAPAVADRSEKELIQAFVDKIEELHPQLVTYNGCAFDLPVLRCRAMIHGIAAPELANRSYYHRFTEHAVDPWDALSSYSAGAKAKLDEISRLMGLDGKPGGMTGGDVESYFRKGRTREISDYRRSDVINTYRLWLRYELFRGKLTRTQFELSETDLGKFLKA
jgi:3'-5' exonuclease